MYPIRIGFFWDLSDILQLREIDEINELASSLRKYIGSLLWNWAKSSFALYVGGSDPQTEIFDVGEVEEELVAYLRKEMLCCGNLIAAVLDNFPEIAMNFHAQDIRANFGAHSSSGDEEPLVQASVFGSGLEGSWADEYDINTWCRAANVERGELTDEQMLELIASTSLSSMMLCLGRAGAFCP